MSHRYEMYNFQIEFEIVRSGHSCEPAWLVAYHWMCAPILRLSTTLLDSRRVSDLTHLDLLIVSHRVKNSLMRKVMLACPKDSISFCFVYSWLLKIFEWQLWDGMLSAYEMLWVTVMSTYGLCASDLGDPCASRKQLNREVTSHFSANISLMCLVCHVYDTTVGWHLLVIHTLTNSTLSL